MTGWHLLHFCPHCGKRPWHANTENLISPHEVRDEAAMRGLIAQCYREWYDAGTVPTETEPGRFAHGDDVMWLVPCGGRCPNRGPMWTHLSRRHPLVRRERPQHALPPKGA